ncbi:Fpg/Nei family DNA glycosylase [Diaminobutyricimonas sp. TR449]|uniref:Fpg/Nei family DNA glycosylase n=1 Tax=Diaminobutyricimonas sp. TR449 TaxID=2708076 RepID=UPI0014236B2C|nr:Fpg/Nei family DNA glycosylase [Diaminobutyricimonas sp. TR449]
MPEGDTVFRTARRLDEALSGADLTVCDIRVPKFATVDLTGQPVHGTVSRGKHLLTRIGDSTVHTHLKMEGSWRLFRPGERWTQPAWKARIVLGTAGWTAVGFELGLVEVLPTSAEADAVGYLGPDVLGRDWDESEALRRMLAHPKVPIGVALIDQTVIAGLGTVYRNEALFLRGIRPERPVQDVPDLPGLITLARRLILANRDRNERVTTGNTRRGERTWVSHRQGERCRRCGTPIQKGQLGPNELMERDTYFCPHCQL